MSIGVIGLGKMGGAIAYRLAKQDIPVSGFDLSTINCQEAARFGVHIESSIMQLIQNSSIIWIMVPVKAVDHIIENIQHHAKPETIVIDGGNSKFIDSKNRHDLLKKYKIHFIDCGTSGGIWGKENGFCLMVGGDKMRVDQVMPYFKIIAAPNAVLYTGPAGSGHYVKMIHNGIEYGIMQAYAEGFHLLHEGQYRNMLNIEKIASVWNKGSIIRSWLLQLTEDIFKEDKDLNSVSGVAIESGMGKWTIEEGERQNIPTPTIKAAYDVRIESQKSGGNFGTKIIALLRNKFGGHTYERQ